MGDNQSVPQGELAICVLAMPKDTNANGDIFGGWLVSHMDMGGGIEAAHRANCRVVTVAIDGMKFIKPVYVGDIVKYYAKLVKVGHTSMQFQMEAWTQSLRDTNSKKVAEGIFTFVAIDDKGNKQLVDRS
ncbi:MAG: acyl-CoA thioesterase [Gammaproteobacteria bacterium]|nr:acyl-CoA thioesterase [Gammaproteobacteria bacterium]